MNLEKNIETLISDKSTKYKYIEVFGFAKLLVDRIEITNQPLINVLMSLAMLSGANMFKHSDNSGTTFEINSNKIISTGFKYFKIVGSNEPLETELLDKLMSNKYPKEKQIIEKEIELQNIEIFNN